MSSDIRCVNNTTMSVCTTQSVCKHKYSTDTLIYHVHVKHIMTSSLLTLCEVEMIQISNYNNM